MSSYETITHYVVTYDYPGGDTPGRATWSTPTTDRSVAEKWLKAANEENAQHHNRANARIEWQFVSTSAWAPVMEG